MIIKRAGAYAAGMIAVVSFLFAVIARLLCAGKAFIGMSALSYLRITNTMLLFAIGFVLFIILDKRE